MTSVTGPPCALPAAAHGLDPSPSDALLHALCAEVPAALLLVDDEGGVRVANGPAAALFGYDDGELDGRPLEQLLRPEDRVMHRQLLGGFLRAPSSREMRTGRKVFGLRRDGSLLPLEVQLRVLHGGGEQRVLALLYDASQRHQAEQRADRAQGLAQAILHSAPLAIIAVDPKGRVLELSEAALALLEAPRGNLLGRRLPLLRLPTVPGVTRRRLMVRRDAELDLGGLKKSERRGEQEWLLYTPSGREVTLQLSFCVLRNATGARLGRLLVAQDMTERKRYEQRIEHLAQHDALTGLANRSLLQLHLERAVEQAVQGAGSCAVLLLDLDNFKRINDTLGHQAGDALLCAVAQRLRGAVQARDRIARISGDEFVVLLNGVRSASDALAVGQRIIERVSAPVDLEGRQTRITASVGIALCPQHGVDVDALLRHADTAMYAAKRSGRSRVLAYTSAMRADADADAALVRALRRTADEAGFALDYQLLVDLDSGQPVGVEALLRWPAVDPTGVFGPERFIPAAERSGLMGRIGAWVVATACEEFAQLPLALRTGLRLCVNLSAAELREPDICTRLIAALRSAGLPASQLEIEIDEAALADSELARVIQGLRSHGLRVALDGFGAAQASLALLAAQPLDRLKLHRSLVAGIDHDPRCGAIIRAALAAAESLGIAVTASGVQEQQQSERLLRSGCREGQGYLYAMPMPLARLIELLGARARPPGEMDVPVPLAGDLAQQRDADLGLP